jgi:uncharacterized protein (DUF1800 family)
MSRLFSLLTCIFTLLASLGPARAALDLNADGVPDVWALVYDAGGVTMSADSDGDGLTNAQEAAAGTNPFSPAGTVRITSITLDPQYGVRLIFPAKAGKRYQVQAVAALGGTWQNLGTPLVGVDGDLTVEPETTEAAQKYYRVVVSDTDSDNDGVTDWEEIQLGFNPHNSHSGGSNGPDDLTAITAALTQPSVVSVVSIDNVATEPTNGGAATDIGAFVISRTGGLRAITVHYNTAGSAAAAGSDYEALSGSVVLGLGVKSVTVPVLPKEDEVLESPEAVLLNLSANAAYTVGTPSSAGVIITDKSTAAGTGLRARYYNEATNLNPNGTGGVPPTFANQVVTRIDPTVAFTWPSGSTQGVHSPAVGVNVDYFACRWTGEVLPEFSQVYTFSAQHNRCARLWVNGQLIVNKWPNNGDSGNNASATTTGTIELTAGVRYPIVLEHFDTTGDGEMLLRWSSANQALEIIPATRLYPDMAPQILGNLDVLLIKDSGPYGYQIQASGSPTSYAAANLPPGTTFNAGTGSITFNPTVAGEWDIPISATNAAGTGSALLHLKVIATGGAITRDVWNGVPGTAVSAIPLTTQPTSTGTVAVLEGPQNAADNYGARIRGYVTAPVSGVYKFFLTAADAAELYISDDDEPANAFLRAAVTAPTGYREWTHANAAQSPLLQLYAGRRYYVEVRHKAGAGSDHVSVGWMQPGQGGDAPAAYVPTAGANVVVPGFVLSPYVPPAPVSGESSLYITNMSAQGSAVTTGYGSASLTLSADETQAILKYNYAGLTTPVTAKHIHSDAFGSHPQGEIIFDIDVATPQPDGSYVWSIAPTGTFSAADCVTAIKQGYAYINVHTATYPNGEIRGNFRLAAASQTFTPPPAQTWSDPGNAANVESALNRNGAARFLTQATFGVSGVDVAPADGNPDDIAKVQALGFAGWIDDQINNAGITYHYPYVFANRTQTSSSGSTYPGTLLFNSWWKNSVTAPDQLRQRLAFALSEILVTSEAGPLDDRADALSDYYDMLLQNAFGNFKDLLLATTLHPAMGRYLDMLGNDKPNPATGRIPNENYAREILQLFSLGLNRLHPDGSLMLNSKGELIPTYDQDVVIGFSHVFTGWYYYSAQTNPYPTSFSGSADWLQPMTPRPARHYTGQKRILNNVVLPGLATLGGVPLDPNATHTTTQINDPAYQALPNQELDAAHEQIFRHPNVGPFICRQLIQRFVTGTPSRGYLYRVVQKFNDNGSGVRGDMKAVIKAILLDYEARSAVAAAAQGFGKQREPVARVTGVARAFPAPPPITGAYAQVGSQINVTTTANHLYSSGQSVFLEFAPATSGDAGQPPDANYTTLTSPAVTPTTFSARVKSFEGDIEYTQANGITTFRDVDSATNDFAYAVGENIHIEYVTGSPVVPVSGFDTLEFRSSDAYTIIFANPTTKRGTYAQSAGSSTMTVTITAHGYTAGSTIHLEAVNGAPLPAITTYTIATVPTANTFTVTTSDTPSAARSGTIFATPPADLVLTPITGDANLCRAADFANRSGPMQVTYGDWNMDTTNTDLNQTPMQSPTVFNFFLPDYQFPGILSNAGLITPEFELTSETSVIRQANTLYNGLFNDNLSQLGLASFKSGARDIMVDLRPWMGLGPGGLPWAHDNNLNALIDELNTRLMAGKLPSTGTNNYAGNPRVIVNAKAAIRDYVVTLPYNRTVSTTAATALATITVNNHGLTSGTSVTIAGVSGSGFTNGTYVATVTGPNTFTVGTACTSTTLNLASATATPSGGSPMPIAAITGFTTVTASAAHLLAAGQGVTISGITGGTFSPSINGTFTIHSVPGSTTLVVPVTRVSSSGVSYAASVLSTPNGFTDLVRDRIRSLVHLLVTSPDFTIQK